jgi:hypothetical protein
MTGKRPTFVNPGTYRRRRLRDAARLLPVVGAFLFLLPILWAPGVTERRDTAPDGIYLFAIWAVLIVIAAALSRRLGDESDVPPPAREEED